MQLIAKDRKNPVPASRERPDQSIGDLIKFARKAKGLSQEDLGRHLGYDSGQFVSDWERGLSAIPMKKLADIAKHLDLDREQLFELLLDFSVARLSESMREEFQQKVLGGKRRKTR